MKKSMGTRPLLILASASPRRLELLSQIGIIPDFVTPAELDETQGQLEPPGQLVRRLAIAKAETALSQHLYQEKNGAFISLGADTVVACGRRILPKAKDEAEARRTLALLSGRRHLVYTGVAVVDRTGKVRARVVKTVVGMKRLETRELDGYLACGEWRGKAGAYGTQGRAAAFVRFINGSYSNVVGLPLFETTGLLNSSGYSVPVRVCET